MLTFQKNQECETLKLQELVFNPLNYNIELQKS